MAGGRSRSTGQQLWRAVPRSYRRSVVYTDFWGAYENVTSDEQHQAVGKDTGLTSHALRSNNTLHQRLARFVRNTLSFSKPDAAHRHFLYAFLVCYNLGRKVSGWE